jgi:hypothetical protein
METSIQDCMKILSKARKRTPNDPSPPLKKKEKGGEGSMVANGRVQAWCLMEGSMLGGQWNVPSLVANGM